MPPDRSAASSVHSDSGGGQPPASVMSQALPASQLPFNRAQYRKSCQFCRRRKIRCLLNAGDSACNACGIRGYDCIFAPIGSNDEHYAPIGKTQLKAPYVNTMSLKTPAMMNYEASDSEIKTTPPSSDAEYEPARRAVTQPAAKRHRHHHQVSARSSSVPQTRIGPAGRPSHSARRFEPYMIYAPSTRHPASELSLNSVPYLHQVLRNEIPYQTPDVSQESFYPYSGGHGYSSGASSSSSSFQTPLSARTWSASSLTSSLTTPSTVSSSVSSVPYPVTYTYNPGLPAYADSPSAQTRDQAHSIQMQGSYSAPMPSAPWTGESDFSLSWPPPQTGVPPPIMSTTFQREQHTADNSPATSAYSASPFPAPAQVPGPDPAFSTPQHTIYGASHLSAVQEEKSPTPFVLANCPRSVPYSSMSAQRDDPIHIMSSPHNHHLAVYRNSMIRSNSSIDIRKDVHSAATTPGSTISAEQTYQ